jgi:hypothetical protein
MRSIPSLRWITPVIALALVAACGTSHAKVAAVSPSATATAQQSPDPSGTVPVGGDVPDNVVWISYSGQVFSVQYPEGWVRNIGASRATFSDKDSYIAVTINSGPPPTTQSVTSEVAAISGAKITIPARKFSLPAGSAIKVSYAVLGAPDPVTGKQPHLVVDRYEIGNAGRVAVLELAAQVGIDNVDAFLAIAKSFKWTV